MSLTVTVSPGQNMAKRRTLKVLIAIVVAAVLIGAFYPKSHPSIKSKKILPENLCAESVLKKYIQSKAALATEDMRETTALQSTVDNFIASRRLEESFCLEFVSCLPLDGNTNSRMLTQSMQFERCVEDEAKDDLAEDNQNE
jgi:hypothetical protein